jgi:hypothetical protein
MQAVMQKVQARPINGSLAPTTAFGGMKSKKRLEELKIVLPEKKQQIFS